MSYVKTAANSLSVVGVKWSYASLNGVRSKYSSVLLLVMALTRILGPIGV